MLAFEKILTEDHYDRAITMVQKRAQKTAEGGGNAPNQQERALTINSAKTNKPRVSRGFSWGFSTGFL